MKLAVVLTRPEADSREMSELIRSRGWSPIVLPLIEIQKLPVNDEVFVSIRKLAAAEWDWIVFTSANAVQIFHEIQLETTGRAEVPGSVQIAAQGEKTSDVVEKLFRRTPDVTPKRATLEGLSEGLLAFPLRRKRILIPCAKVTREVLVHSLTSAGASTTLLPIYETLDRMPQAPEWERLRDLDPRDVIFTLLSPSAVKPLDQLLRGPLQHLASSRLASIGPITTQAIEELGREVFVESEVQSGEALISAIAGANFS